MAVDLVPLLLDETHGEVRVNCTRKAAPPHQLRRLPQKVRKEFQNGSNSTWSSSVWFEAAAVPTEEACKKDQQRLLPTPIRTWFPVLIAIGPSVTALRSGTYRSAKTLSTGLRILPGVGALPTPSLASATAEHRLGNEIREVDRDCTIQPPRVCTTMSTYVYMHVCIYVCMYNMSHTYIYTSLHLCLVIHTSMYLQHIYISIHLCIYMPIHP